VFGSFVARHVSRLRDAGADVTVVANSDNRRGLVRNVVKYIRLEHRARRAARPGRFDAVVGHYLYPTAAFARDAARKADVPLVLVVHGTDTRSILRKGLLARRSRRALDAADLVVTVSRALRETLMRDVAVPASVPISVVDMGFDETVFMPCESAREDLGVPTSTRLVVFVGNLEPVKGVDLLLDAFSVLLADGTADRLVIVGDGSLASEFRDRIDRPDLNGGVTMLGAASQRDVARWMAAADVLVLPSRNEGLGLVLLEAMACGTPCVATRVGGVPEIMDDSCGRLVPPEDPIALAAAVAEIIAQGKDRYSGACVARAAEHTSAAKAEEFLGHVERVVGDRGPQG